MEVNWTDAARDALKRIGAPADIPTIFSEILNTDFNHGSSEPYQTLRNEIRKSLRGHRHIAARGQEVFYQPAKGFYGLTEWDDNASPQTTTPDSLTNDTAIVPERDYLTMPPLPEEIPSSSDIIEGSVKTIQVNAYERDPEARRQCIVAHGTRCCVCDRTLESQYGEIAKDLIHIHHRRPLSELRASHRVDPINDLCPVCPNCHAVIHRRRPAYEVDEIRALYRAAATKNSDGF